MISNSLDALRPYNHYFPRTSSKKTCAGQRNCLQCGHFQFNEKINNRYSPSRLPEASEMLQLIGLAEPSDMALVTDATVRSFT